uniref:tetratricopeptide repeat protein n=1 Tax=uncultured Desulfovibrio sp. TaxID=167968 RepID=UPI00260BCAC2
MPQKKEATTRYTDKNGPQFLRKILAAAALPRAVLRCRSFFKSLFSKGEDRPLPQRTLLAAAICLPLAAICLSTVTENAFFILGEERGRGMDKAYAALRCRLSAGLGDVEAQVRLAKLYAEGHGLPRDEEKSLFWYGEAAGQGHAEAQRYLAFEAYSLTWAEMARWRQKLADQGDVRAKYLLGDMYAKGIGVPQDKAEALYWFRSAADQEYDSAQFMLGDMYAASDGVPQDKVLAAEWFRKAAEQGHGEARFRLGGMYAKGDGVPQDKAEAACWYRKAALRGHDEAAFELGSMYAKGDGVPQDKAEAACWYRKAAEQ